LPHLAAGLPTNWPAPILIVSQSSSRSALWSGGGAGPTLVFLLGRREKSLFAPELESLVRSLALFMQVLGCVVMAFW